MTKTNYRYTFIWQTNGIPNERRRTDVAYTPREFSYKYRARSISIIFKPEEVRLSFEANTLLQDKSINEIIMDVLEKIYIIYTMVYSYGFEAKKPSIVYEKTDSEAPKWVEFSNTENSIDASLFLGSLLVKGSFPLKNPVFNNNTWTSDANITAYLQLRESEIKDEQRKLKSAVYAWIMAKFQGSAYERFQYLWIAYNALYFHYGRNLRYKIAFDLEKQLGRDTISPKEGSKKLLTHPKIAEYATSDLKAVENMCKLMGYSKIGLSRNTTDIEIENEDELSDNEIKRIKNSHAGTEIEKAIGKYWDGQKVTIDSLRNDHIVLANAIQNAIKNSKSNPKKKQTPKQKANAANESYSFLITTFNYTCLRCKHFHGGAPIPIYSYFNDPKIPSFELASGLIEDLLDQFLYPTLIRKDKINQEAECNTRLAILAGQDINRASEIYEKNFKKEVADIKKKIEKELEEKEKKSTSQTPPDSADTSSPPPDTAPSELPSVNPA